MQPKIQKRCSDLKKVAFLWILCFALEAIPHPSCYLNSIMDKTRHEPVIALFRCNFCGLFSYARGDLVVPGASAYERGGILALSHMRDARIFSQLVVFAFSQEKEKQVFYFIIKLC